jgi:hypothetical protein
LLGVDDSLAAIELLIDVESEPLVDSELLVDAERDSLVDTDAATDADDEPEAGSADSLVDAD